MGQLYLKNVMTRGEITPLAHGRLDIDAYRASVAEMLNFTTLRFGGARRRSGTQYLGPTRYTDKEVRLIPFVFNEDQAYMVEFGDYYIRFWTQAAGVYGVVLSSGTPYQIATPYPASAVEKLQWSGSFDTMYLTHGSYKPQALRRYGHTNWTISDVAFVDGPYMPINDTSTTVSFTAVGGVSKSVVATWSSAAQINDGAGWTSADIGRYVRYKGNAQWTYARITAVTNTTKVTLFNVSGSGITKVPYSTVSWRLGSFGVTPGYPASVATFDGRQVYARTNAEPRTLWMSKSGYPTNFSPSNTAGTVVDSDAAYYTLLSQRADAIQWIVDAARLQVGTASAIRSVGATDTSLAVGPRNVNQRIEVSAGASSVMPAQVDQVTMFGGRFGRKLRDLVYDYTLNGLVSSEVSLLSEHLLRASLKWMAYQEEPDSTLWFGMSDGSLAGLTISRTEKVAGFHSHDLAGGTVISAATMPGATGDDLWLAVRRTINGQTVTYMERLKPPFEDMAKEDAFCVDCGATYSGAATSTVSGLGHLEGETVQLFADGTSIGSATVASGVVTLPGGRTASKIHVGLGYTSRIKTTRLPVQGDGGVMLGRKKRVSEVGLFLVDTLGLKINGLSQRAFEVKYRDPSSPSGSSPNLFSGIVWAKIEDTWENDGQFELSVDTPVPATILALNVHVDQEEMA